MLLPEEPLKNKLPEDTQKTQELTVPPRNWISRHPILSVAGTLLVGTGGGVTGYALDIIPAIRPIDSFTANHGFGLNSDGRKLCFLHAELSASCAELSAGVLKNDIERKGLPNAELFKKLTDCILVSEWIRFVKREESHAILSTQEVRDQIYAPFREKVINQYNAEVKNLGDKVPDSPTKFMLLKKAFDDCLGNTLYLREANCFIDPLVKRADGINRMQCQSGSWLCMSLAREVIDESSGYKLVYIYTKGHILPGLACPDGSFIGAETTVIGGRIDFTKASLASGKMVARVTDAFMDDYSRISGCDLNSNIVIAQSPGNFEPSNVPGSSSDVSSRFAFGTPDAPSGDQIRNPVDTLSTNTYGSNLGVYSRLGDQNRALLGSEDKKQDLISKLSDTEKALLSDYFSHTSKSVNYYEKHVVIFNSDTLSIDEKIAKLTALVNEHQAVLRKDGIVEKYEGLSAALEKKRLELPWNGLHAVGIDAIIVNNVNYLNSKR